MGFLLDHKLSQVSPVQRSLEGEGRAELSAAQSRGVTTSEAACLESLMWKAGMTLFHFLQESPKLLTPQTFCSENSLASVRPPQGLNERVGEEQPLRYAGPGTPPQDSSLSQRREVVKLLSERDLGDMLQGPGPYLSLQGYN